MRKITLALFSVFILLFASSAAQSQCDLAKKLGVSRTIEIDTKDGPLFGRYSFKQTLPLRRGEVILTFDDGPHPQNTISILKTLKDHCTKATFFAVGSMAALEPGTLKAVADAGHSIAAHSQTHPKMPQIPLANAKIEIEKSIEEIIKAAGPVAPFFRYPGLRYSHEMNAYLKTRGIAVLSVDIVSGDTKNKNTQAIISQTLSLLKRRKRGIILLHDLQKTTAEALPELLDALKKNGYKVVHIVGKKKLYKSEYKKVMKEYIAGLKANKSTQKSDEIRVADKQKEPEILTYHNKEIWKEISEALVNFFDG